LRRDENIRGLVLGRWGGLGNKKQNKHKHEKQTNMKTNININKHE